MKGHRNRGSPLEKYTGRSERVQHRNRGRTRGGWTVWTRKARTGSPVITSTGESIYGVLRGLFGGSISHPAPRRGIRDGRNGKKSSFLSGMVVEWGSIGERRSIRAERGSHDVRRAESGPSRGLLDWSRWRQKGAGEWVEEDCARVGRMT